MEEVPDAAPGCRWTEDLRRLLQAHRTADDREAESARRFLSELDRLTRPWDEDADPVHVTASAIVVGTRGTVLHRHRRLGRWMQPGGHVDDGELPAEAARREVHEETGLPSAHPPGGPLLVHVDVHDAAKGHTHLDLRYLLVAEDAEPRPLPGESPDVRWCTWEEADRLADAALVGALRTGRRVWEDHREAWASPGPGGLGPGEEGGTGAR